MPPDFAITFQRIRPLFAKHEAANIILHDEPGRYYLATHHVRPKDGYRLWFGGVEIKKNYVSAHVMALYTHPGLLTTMSAPLRKRMQGKACFNFKTPDDALFAELSDIIGQGAILMK